MTAKEFTSAFTQAEKAHNLATKKARKRIRRSEIEKPDLFMILPPEIRSMIYEYVSRPETFDLGKVGKEPHPYFGIKVSEIRLAHSRERKRGYLPALASTSKAIRREFLPLWYSLNVIIFRAPSTHLQSALDWLIWLIEDFTRLGIQQSLSALSLQLDVTKIEWRHLPCWRPAAEIARLSCVHQIGWQWPLHRMAEPQRREVADPAVGLLSIATLGNLAHREGWEPQHWEECFAAVEKDRRALVKSTLYLGADEPWRFPSEALLPDQLLTAHGLEDLPAGSLFVCTGKIPQPMFGSMAEQPATLEFEFRPSTIRRKRRS